MSMSAQNWFFLLLACAAVGLMVLAIRTAHRGKAVKVSDSWLLVVVLTGLVYDNAMLAFGSSLGEGTLTMVLSAPRFVLHGLFTPLLIMFAALSADRMDVPGYRDRERITLWGAIAFVAVLVGLVNDIVQLSLTPTVSQGILSYKHLDGGPPVAEIITVVSLLVIGGVMQRYARWPWVFVGAAQMFVIAAFYVSNTFLANLGELVLLSCMVATGMAAVTRTAAERDARREAALSRRSKRSPTPMSTGS